MLLNIFIGSIVGGIINRLRGWGNGWNQGKQKWLMWIQSKLLNRPLLGACMGLLLAYFSHLAGHTGGECFLVWLTTWLCWWFAVTPGWGEYFDGVTIPNKEIGWIDTFVEKTLRPFLRKRNSSRADDPDFIDSFSFGLRGFYFVPLYLALWPIAGAWILLPLLFFWQDALVYRFFRKKMTTQFVLPSELVSGTLRTALMLIAIVLG